MANAASIGERPRTLARRDRRRGGPTLGRSQCRPFQLCPVPCPCASSRRTERRLQRADARRQIGFRRRANRRGRPRRETLLRESCRALVLRDRAWRPRLLARRVRKPGSLSSSQVLPSTWDSRRVSVARYIQKGSRPRRGRGIDGESRFKRTRPQTAFPTRTPVCR